MEEKLIKFTLMGSLQVCVIIEEAMHDLSFNIMVKSNVLV